MSVRQSPGVDGPLAPQAVILCDEDGIPYVASGGGGGSNVTVVNGPAGAAVNIQDGGNSITVDATDLDIRNLVFATDKVDVTGSSVAVSNFPATQPVSGTVAVSNFPATQPISAAALPLPTGAATSGNQTTEIASLASIKTNTDPLVTSNAGGYVRQDSTATIAKETGGNLASVKTNTDTLVGVVNVKAAITQVGSPTLNLASDNGSPIVTATTTDVVAAPAAGNHLEITRIHASNGSATPCLVSWKEAGGNLMFPANLPQYGIVSIDLKGGWHLTTATKLQLVTSAAGSISWTVGSRTVPD